jgi:hypothetical protein
MLIYVDEIVIVGSTSADVEGLVHSLSTTFPMEGIATLE